VIEWQTIKDRLCFPLLALLSSEQARALSLTPIDEERVAIALGRCRGLLLDIGCGTNELAGRYRLRQGTAIGVDVYPWPGADVAMIAENFYHAGFNILYPQVNWAGNAPGYMGRSATEVRPKVA
jgi:hypothetical protein